MTTSRRSLRLLAALVVGLLALCASSSPAQAQAEDDYVVGDIDASQWPVVRTTVTGPSVTGDPDDAFVVTEDGEPVPVDVVQLRGGTVRPFHVMVAIDLSGSMAGDPIEQAKSAVFTLAQLVPADAKIGVVGFGDTARVVQPFTADRDQIFGSVFPLVAEGETSLYDGVSLALDQLVAAGGDQTLIVLSDGKDSASTATLDQLLARLMGATVETSIVTLQTEDFDGAVAQTIAEAASGSVLPVEQASAFTTAFADVASSLGNVWELRWRSSSTQADAAVSVSVAGAAEPLTATYTHEVAATFVPDVATETIVVEGATGPLQAPWVPIVAAFFLMCGAVALLGMARNSEASVQRRAERKADKEFEREQHKTKLSGAADKLTDISDHLLEGNDRGRTLDDALDRAGLAIRSGELVAFTAAMTVVAIPVGLFLFGAPFGVAFVVAPFLLVKLTLQFMTSRRRKKFVEQLGDTLQLMAGSLTAGYGLGQTLDSVAREAESPTADEFSRVVMETRLGRSLEDALDAMSKRIQAPDFDWVVDAIKIQSSVGGNLSEIIEQVGETIRARTRIRRQVAALTAEGKISALVLFALPFGLIGFISMSNPAYVAPLFGSSKGYMMLGAAGTLMSLGGLWLKKLVNPEF